MLPNCVLRDQDKGFSSEKNGESKVMMAARSKYNQLVQLLKKAQQLKGIESVLSWDQLVRFQSSVVVVNAELT